MSAIEPADAADMDDTPGASLPSAPVLIVISIVSGLLWLGLFEAAASLLR